MQSVNWPLWAGFVLPRTGPSPALLAAVICCFFAGALRYAAHPIDPCWIPSDLAYYNLPASQAFDTTASEVTLQGYVSGYPFIVDTKQQLQITVQSITLPDPIRNEHVTGVVRLTTDARQRYRYGQSLRVSGRLVTPPEFEDFSYRDYLARKGIHSLIYRAKLEVLPDIYQGNWLYRHLYQLRARGETVLNRLLPEPYAALANGMLLGIEAGIPDALYEQFNLTGTSHVIVISGSNISLLAGILLALGQKLFGRRRALWPTLIGITCYALLVGGDAAVLRAAFMGALFVIATVIDRRSTALISLAVACFVMTIMNPLTLWDVGFQLSSAATAGLILFVPSFSATIDRVWAVPTTGSLPGGISYQATKFNRLIRTMLQEGLLITVAANITTLPLVAYYFQRISVISLLTNLLIVPVQPLIMIWGSLALVLGLLGISWLAWAVLLVPWLSLMWTVTAVRWTATLPGASVEIQGYGLMAVLLTYGLIGGVYWRESLWTRLRGTVQQLWQTHGPTRMVGPGLIGLFSIVSILLWSIALSQPDGRLHLYFLDVGQGDGILIQTPSGRQILIDGGASPQQLMSELGAVMPFWDRSIDLLILSHPDADHMNAQVQIPSRFALSMAINTHFGQEHPAITPWLDAMNAAGVEIVLAQQGSWIDLGDGVALWGVWPPPEPFLTDDMDNENSLVYKLVYGDLSVLLTGDAGRPSERAWLESDAPIAATVLKVGHHGSTTASDPTFLATVDPAIAIVQVGADNRYGHPHAETIAALTERFVLRNDQHGRIHLWSDGRQLWMDPVPPVD